MKQFWVVLISVIVTGGLVGGGTYFYINTKSTSDKNNLQAQINELNKKIANNDTAAAEDSDDSTSDTTDPTANWKTLSDSHYNITFKYPDSWPTKTSQYLSAAQNDLLGVAESSVSFTTDAIADKGKMRTVSVAKLSDFTDNIYKTQIAQLKSVYAQKSATPATGKIMLPPVNAAVSGATSPTYIETKDGTFRGIYFFASIGQDISTTIDSVIILTDNTNVVCFHFALPSDKAGDYTKKDGTIDQSFLEYVKTLNTKSSETIVSEFNSTHKNMALSLATASVSTGNSIFTAANLKSSNVSIDGNSYKLTNGSYTYSPAPAPANTPTYIVLDEKSVAVDSKNSEQAATILNVTERKNGTTMYFSYLEIMGNRGGNPQHIADVNLDANYKDMIEQVTFVSNIITIKVRVAVQGTSETSTQTISYKLTSDSKLVRQ